MNKLDILIKELEKVKTLLSEIKKVVNQQAEDPALWAISKVELGPNNEQIDYPISIGEAYLQQELRRLHSAIEHLDDECICGEINARNCPVHQ